VIDYNAYRQGAGWRYYSSTVQIMTNSFEEFRRATGYEKHGIQFDGFSNAAPAEGSPLIDAGMVLPNVNDDFTGKAPDIGPYEFGRPLPHYGPRGGARAKE
jgi:hypothetical protein